MRPRLITAENTARRLTSPTRKDASMRPRLITAENAHPNGYPGLLPYGFNEAAAHHRGKRAIARCLILRLRASMRPRLITAENRLEVATLQRVEQASMRPRLITAENAGLAKKTWTLKYSFNEAAAHHRGKRKPAGCCTTPTTCFNEAAAHHRGKREWRVRVRGRHPRFNEAAAHHRGKLACRPRRAMARREASMRPRLITAENSTARCGR